MKNNNFLPIDISKPETYMYVKEYTIEKDWDFHAHNFIEIELVISGSGSIVINNTEYRLEPKCLYFINSFDYHKVTCDREPPRVINISLSEDYIPPVMKKQCFGESELPSVFMYLKDDYEQFLSVMRLLCDENDHLLAGAEEMMTGLTEVLLIRMLRKMSGININTADKNEASEAISRAMVFMRRNFRRNITLADVAETVYLTPNYFSRCFHNAFNMTYSQYLNNIRLNAAVKALMSTDSDMSVISTQCGFPSISTFYRNFSKKYGIAPAEYRQKYMKINI